ncbi:hypothetical protein MCEMSE15_02957 [Fimbriimonadaceae bacterium]|jgi:hypothetical protein
MGLAFILFWILVIWGLVDGELYWQEAGWYTLAFVACILGFIFLAEYQIWFIVPIVLIDVVLIMKMMGNPRIGG